MIWRGWEMIGRGWPETEEVPPSPSGPDDNKPSQHFECGTGPWTKPFAREIIGSCNNAVIEGANLCCKEHDLCYDVHSLRGYTRDYCDLCFCHCLQDIQDKAKDCECSPHLDAFCRAVIDWGQSAFDKAKPEDHAHKFVGFVDHRPLGLDMQKLVDACPYGKMIAVHCHNSVVRCLQKDHERFSRMEMEEGIVEHSYEDCRSTMFDCLQTIIESGAGESCTFVARNITNQLNVYTDLDEQKHGQSIIDIYPVIAARLLMQSTLKYIFDPEIYFLHKLEKCFREFDQCAVAYPEEHPEFYHAARKIRYECHYELKICVDGETFEDTREDCREAVALAISRIRKTDLNPPKGHWDLFKDWIHNAIAGC